MTKQEYIKKESEKLEASKSSYLCAGAFAEGNRIGLSNGLDIACRFVEWVEDNFISVVGHDGCWNRTDEFIFSNTQECKRYLTEELLEIYLTENEKK